MPRTLSLPTGSALTLALALCGCGGSSYSPSVMHASTSSLSAALAQDAIPDAGHLTWNPPSLTFTKKGAKQSTVLYNTNPDLNTKITTDTCTKAHIAKYHYFDYGIYQISPGTVKGTCAFTAIDKGNGAKGTVTITNRV